MPSPQPPSLSDALHSAAGAAAAPAAALADGSGAVRVPSGGSSSGNAGRSEA